jgi:cell division protein FtsB
MTQAPNRRPLVLLMLIGGCVLFIVAYTGRLAEQARLREQLIGWQARIAAVEQRQAELAAQLQYVQSDGYVHEQAREALNLVLPGDELLVVVEGAPAPLEEQVTAAPVAPLPAAVPNWQQWLDLFWPEVE